MGRPSLSRPRTECQKVLIATPEITCSTGLGECAVYGADYDSSSSPSFTAPPSGVYSNS